MQEQVTYGQTGATTQSINVTTSGSYTVKVTNASGCQSAESVATIVTVNALPSASITKADNSGLANNDGIICNGTTATLTASGGTFYSWSSGETTAAIVKGIAGTYTVTVTNANGCTDTEAANITVNAVPIVTAGSNSPVCVGDKTINLTSSGGKDTIAGAVRTASQATNKTHRYILPIKLMKGFIQ